MSQQDIIFPSLLFLVVEPKQQLEIHYMKTINDFSEIFNNVKHLLTSEQMNGNQIKVFIYRNLNLSQLSEMDLLNKLNEIEKQKLLNYVEKDNFDDIEVLCEVFKNSFTYQYDIISEINGENELIEN